MVINCHLLESFRMRIEQLIEILKSEFPEETAIEDDKIGLQIYTGTGNIDKILISMELNSQVAEEAVTQKCQCIISFHPLIYRPLDNISINSRIGSILTQLIKADISIFIVHTNFDAYHKGTNFVFAQKLELTPINVLYPSDKFEGSGIGLIAKTEDALSQQELLSKISAICHSPLRYCNGSKNQGIKNIGIICGSGSSLLKDEFVIECDAFITADISYHTFHRFDGKMMLIDPGHYEMEQFVPEAMLESLKSNYSDELPEIILSKVYTNPVHYFPNTEEYRNKQINYRLLNKWE